MGYQTENIYFDYEASQKERIDVVIKTDEGVLATIEVKDQTILTGRIQ